MANPRTIARVEAQIQRRAAHCLQAELADPRAGFVTITKVEASQDLSSASIHYSVLGSEADRSRVEHMLEEAGGFIQRRVASSLRLRNAPRLHWRDVSPMCSLTRTGSSRSSMSHTSVRVRSTPESSSSSSLT